MKNENACPPIFVEEVKIVFTTECAWHSPFAGRQKNKTPSHRQILVVIGFRLKIESSAVRMFTPNQNKFGSG